MHVILDAATLCLHVSGIRSHFFFPSMEWGQSLSNLRVVGKQKAPFLPPHCPPLPVLKPGQLVSGVGRTGVR